MTYGTIEKRLEQHPTHDLWVIVEDGLLTTEDTDAALAAWEVLQPGYLFRANPPLDGNAGLLLQPNSETDVGKNAVS